MRATIAFGLGLVGALAVAGCTGSSATPPAEEVTEDRCTSCHMTDYQSAHPVHVDVKPTACSVCHLQEAWHPSVLRHEWTLTGKHFETSCFECHKGKPAVFRGTARECIGCHATERAREDKKDTWHDHFPKTCEECHQTSSWKPAKSEPGFEEEPEPTPPPKPHPSATAPPKPTAPKPIPKPTATPTATPTIKPVPTPTTPPTVLPPVDPLSGASKRHR